MSIELDSFVTKERVAQVFRYVRDAQHVGRDSIARHGYRAAQSRNPKLLLALQKGSEVLQRWSEETHGAHGIDVGGISVSATEFQLWRNAYTAADAGRPEDAYSWIYGMAGILAGVVSA